MAKYNWHFAGGTAIVNTLTRQAWRADDWNEGDWNDFIAASENARWFTVRRMPTLEGDCVCPRCRIGMDPRRHALSRLTNAVCAESIYVCSDCGVEEAILQWHNKGIPVDWRESK